MLARLFDLIPPLRQLLASGCVTHNFALLPGVAHLLHPLIDGAGAHTWVISQRVLALRGELASDAELLCALLAQHASLRASWVSIAAARCKEAGQMRTASALEDIVSQLQAAASWVEAALPTAQLVASPYAELERELLGVSFEQASATPALMRLLAAAARLAHYQDALPSLPQVDSTDIAAQQNWIHGRFIALPHSRTLAPQALLSNELSHAQDDSLMTWVLRQPWALLLAMLVYAQDVWQAEGRGGVSLRLAGGQAAYAPQEIIVVVLGSAGDEVACGSVADVVLAALAQLGMACFPAQPSNNQLNALLTPVIGELLERQVWRYQDGASGEAGQYHIHPQFADACYRLPGSKVFHRHGRLLWQTLRASCEALYQANSYRR